MKRSVQEIIELLVFGLIAVLIGTGLLWVVGWVIGGLGALFKLLAGLIWSLLRFVVPIAVVGAAVYALVRLLQGQREPATSTASTGTGAGGPGTAGSTNAGASGTAAPTSAPPAAPPPAEATSAHATEPASQRAAGVDEPVEGQGDGQVEDVSEEGGEEGERAASDDDVRRSGAAAHEHGAEADEPWEKENHVGEHHESPDREDERDEDEDEERR